MSMNVGRCGALAGKGKIRGRGRRQEGKVSSTQTSATLLLPENRSGSTRGQEVEMVRASSVRSEWQMMG